MVLARNCAPREGQVDEIGKRLLRPFRLWKSIGVARFLDEVCIDPFLPTTRGLNPKALSQFAGLNIVPVPGVIQVPGWDATKEENVAGLARQCQAKPQNLPARKEAHRQVFFDQVQGDKTAAGKMLGISRATLYRKLKRYNIRAEKSFTASA